MPESIVEWKPRPRERVFVKLSGGRFFTVPQSVSLPLQQGAVLTDEEIAHLSRIDQYCRGRDKALRLLAIRSRTRHEIRRALDGIEVAPAIRDGIVAELKEEGLIDDRRFARDYVRNRVEIKHLGPHRLRFELRKLGIHEVLADEVIAAEVSERSQEETAWRIVGKKLGARRPDEKDVRRISALLQRKGIDYEIINHVAYELLQKSRENEACD